MITHSDDNLDDLLEAARLNELGDAQFDRLHQRLREDQSARRAYAEYMTLHAMLLWECPDRAAALEADAPPVLPMRHNPLRRRVAWWKPLAIAAAVALVASIAAVTYLSTDTEPAEEPVATYTHHDPVGVVVGGDSTAWQTAHNNTMLSPGASVHAGQIALDTGETEIELFGGVRVHLTGPVRAMVVDAMRLTLTRGKVRATVPHESVGFTIDAAGVRVIDLGTVFEVDVSEDGAVDVSVIEGKVQTMMNVPGDEVYTLRLGARSRVRLNPAGGTVSRFNPWTRQFNAPLSVDWRPIDTRGRIRFAAGALHPYADQDGYDDQPTVMDIRDDGRTLHLAGNAWKYLPLDYDVTPDTVIEFDYRTDHLGEMHGVAFDDDNNVGTRRRLLLVAGRLNHPQAFSDYKKPPTAEWTRRRLPVGKHYQGPMKQLVFFADDDRDGRAECAFRDVRVFENETVTPQDQGAE